jgi:UDP-N-acetylglucosamine 2-epimerase
MQPDCVVIGSHLGGIYIRALQVICHNFSIPCFSFWGIEVEARNAVALPRYLPMPYLLKSVLHWPPVNAYTQTHKFAVTGNALKRHLMTKGILESQIVVTGNPTHDNFIEKKPEKRPPATVHFEDGRNRYVVYLTEVLQEVFGLDHLQLVLKSIGEASDGLPPSVKVYVKFHPRETAETKAVHRSSLKGPRFVFLEETDLVRLISQAELSIGGWTKALETSFILGVPVLAINFTGLPQYSVYPNHGLMECANPKEVKAKFTSFFSDPVFRQEAHQIAQAWLADNICGLDGQNTTRMAEAIIAHAGEHRRGLCGSYSPA